MNTGSSSDGEEGSGRWKWGGEIWWYKVEYQGAVNLRLRRRISRSVKATLEQDTMRWRDGWYQLRSRIEWLEAKKQQGSSQSKLRTRPVVWWVSRRGGQGFLVEPVHVMQSSSLIPLQW